MSTGPRSQRTFRRRHGMQAGGASQRPSSNNPARDSTYPDRCKCERIAERVIASPSFSVSWNHGLQRFKVGGTSDRMPSLSVGCLSSSRCCCCRPPALSERRRYTIGRDRSILVATRWMKEEISLRAPRFRPRDQARCASASCPMCTTPIHHDM